MWRHLWFTDNHYYVFRNFKTRIISRPRMGLTKVLETLQWQETKSTDTVLIFTSYWPSSSDKGFTLNHKWFVVVKRLSRLRKEVSSLEVDTYNTLLLGPWVRVETRLLSRDYLVRLNRVPSRSRWSLNWWLRGRRRDGMVGLTRRNLTAKDSSSSLFLLFHVTSKFFRSNFFELPPSEGDVG